MLTLVRDRYELQATLGSGGEARIVKALDRQHGRFVALKIRPVRDGTVREELLGEARVLLALPPHPALPLVREDFFDGDSYVVAMDWVDGTNLATLLAERGRPGLPASSVLAYLAQAAEALTHLHAQSPPVIHGDVKPGNLILTTGGRIKLVDFGLSSAPNVPLRRAGTPGYRAPELAAGASPSRASDVYALAATAFALLTGAPPAGILPSWEGVLPVQAEQLEEAIRLGMATHPARRPATPGELVERLRAGWAAGLPTGVTTFCLSAIDDSVALWDAHPGAMADALVRHDELIADASAGHGGSFIASMGDATVCVFDSAPAAVAAALAAQRALAAEPWPPGIAIATGWGLHTGEVERRDAHYVGSTVNLAARVREQAEAGQILLSEVTAELVAGHLPEGCALVELGPHRLTGRGPPQRISALTGPGVRAPLGATDCPYRGLPPFGPDDRRFFFGRERVVAEILGRLAPGRLLALVGASGSGKSSVLRAGVVAAVRAGEIEGLRHASLLTPGATPALDLDDAPDRLVVVDQFEELFTLCDDADLRRAFIDELLAASGPVAIGVRADLYGGLAAHPELARVVSDSHMLLGAMSDTELERAVTEPARLAGLRLEPGLVELALRDVDREPGALPLLSHALRATWERRDGRTLTIEGYRESGGVSAAIAKTADSVVGSLPAERRQLARNVFVRLTELGEGSADTRRRVSIDELVPEGVPSGLVEELLQRLADARLLTLGDGTAEVAHEVLIREWPRLRRWLDEDREGIRARRQLSDAARLWDVGGRAPADLYRGTRLASAVDLAQPGRAELNATEHAFLEDSLAEAERERRAQQRANRRLRGLLAGAAVLLVAAAAAGVLSVIQRHDAQVAESAANRQALTSDAERVGALALSAPSLTQSMLFAVAGVELEDRPDTRSDLLAALQHNPATLRTLRLPSSGLMALAASADGRLLAYGDETGSVGFVDVRTWRPAGAPVRLGAPVGVEAMQFSPDGRTVAVGTQKGDRYELQIVDVAKRRARRVWSRGGLLADSIVPTTALAYAPAGRRLAMAVATMSVTSGMPVAQRVLVLDSVSGRELWERRVPMHRDQSEAHVSFTGDGRLITSAATGDTIVWDGQTGSILRRYPIGGPPAVAPDGHTLALVLDRPAAPRSAIAVLDLRSGRQTDLAEDLRGASIDQIAFSPDGSRILGSSSDGLHVWDVASGAISESYPGAVGGAAPGVVVDTRGLAIAGAGVDTIGAWDIDGRQRLGRRFSWGTRESGCQLNPCAVIAPAGKLMASTQAGGTVAMVDLRSGRLIHTFPARNGPLAAGVAFTSDGRQLITGGVEGTVTIWDVATGALTRRLRFATPVFATAVSPDGRLLAVTRQADGARDAQVEVRDVTSGETLFTRTIRGGAGDLQFSPDGRALFAVGCCRGGSTVAAWDAPTGAPRFERTQERHLTALAILPDSRSLLVGDEDGAVARWNARTGTRLGAATAVASAAVQQIAVSPRGRLFAVADLGGSATLWDVRTRKRVGDEFPVATGFIPAVAFAAGGPLVITEAGRATAWPTDTRSLQRFACQVADRSVTRAEWRDLLPGRPYRQVCPAR